MCKFACLYFVCLSALTCANLLTSHISGKTFFSHLSCQIKPNQLSSKLYRHVIRIAFFYKFDFDNAYPSAEPTLVNLDREYQKSRSFQL